MAKIVIALGGNALGDNAIEQAQKVQLPAKVITQLIKEGHDVIIGHGNGPQVGAIFNAFSTAHNIDAKIPVMPFAECGGMSQGYIGYHVQTALINELKEAGIDKEVEYFLTQTIVDKNDPAFSNPTKPVGAFYQTRQEAIDHNAPGSTIIEVPNKGFRRVVASPKPLTLMCMKSVKEAVRKHKVVICGGGGGIPTIIDSNKYIGVDGVIDKDSVASMVAKQLKADMLIILTNVANACINYGKPDQKVLGQVSIKEMKQYIKQKQFAAGSMLPKVLAAMEFAKSGKNRKAIIAQLEDLPKAIKGEAGTIITK